MLAEFRGKKPRIHKTAFVHPSATLIGDVVIGAHSSVWPGAVLRGDFAGIRTGRYVCIQDNAVLHPGDIYDGKRVRYIPVKIGDYVVIGHNALLHGCTVESNCMVGGGSMIFDGARVRKGSLVGLGAVVLQGGEVRPRTVVVGIPARTLRTLVDGELKSIRAQAMNYAKLAGEYLSARLEITGG